MAPSGLLTTFTNGMDHHGQAVIVEQEQVDSDASTISCPPSPVIAAGGLEQSAEEQGVTGELASIQEELQTVLEYVDHGMLLKSFDTLSRLTDIVVANCEKLGKFTRLLANGPFADNIHIVLTNKWCSNLLNTPSPNLTNRSSLGWRWSGRTKGRILDRSQQLLAVCLLTLWECTLGRTKDS